MTKAKKPAANVAATKNEAAPKKTSPKKNYMVDDEDEDELELDKKEEDDDELDADLNDADIVIPKSFDPFDDDDDDDDDF